ncbi:hypothetical protein ACXR0O_25165 [Verrucomicrobiota bacterium sgz303538]
MESPKPGELIFVPYVDWLLTNLVFSAPAQLSAELVPNSRSVSWCLRSLDSGEECILDNLSSSYFRPVLARMALSYMAGCVYGGYRRFHLRSGILIHPMALYLGNDSLTGLWFRGRCGTDIIGNEVEHAEPAASENAPSSRL